MLFLLINILSVASFSPSANFHLQSKVTSSINMIPTVDFEPLVSSSTNLAAATVDPTTALSNVLGGLLGSPAILAVPILAAVSVASLIAFFIVSYANPADPDE